MIFYKLYVFTSSSIYLKCSSKTKIFPKSTKKFCMIMHVSKYHFSKICRVEALLYLPHFPNRSPTDYHFSLFFKFWSKRSILIKENEKTGRSWITYKITNIHQILSIQFICNFKEMQKNTATIDQEYEIEPFFYALFA